MRVLITGMGGFIGSHLLDHILLNTDWDVVGIDSFRHKGLTDRITDSQVYQAHRDRVSVFTHDLIAPISPSLQQDLGQIDIIYNLASESHVDRSITDPVRFIQNNVSLVLTMLEYARVVKPEAFFQISTDEVYGPAPSGYAHHEWDTVLPSNPYAASKAAQEAIAVSYWRTYGVPVVITNCWDMETRVMTNRGFLSHESLNVGDLVWTLDEHESLVLQPVIEKVRMAGPSTMIRIELEKVDQVVTPNHRMMVRRSVGSPRRWSAIEETPAESLVGMNGRVRIPLTGQWNGTLEAFPADHEPTWLATVVGWYVSEGYPAGDAVAFGAGTDEQATELLDLLADVGHPYRNGRSVRVLNRELSVILSACGLGAENKVIPQWILNAPSDVLRAFWVAAMRGDGSHLGEPGAEVYYTTSQRLAEQMCEVGMKLGYGVRVSRRATWNPSKTVLSESLIVRFRVGSASVEAKDVTQVPYTGDVWCIRVPSGRVFIERNGIISLTGQTMNNFGERQDPEKFVPMVIRAVEAGEVVPIHGTPGQIGSRFYLHARNHADALMWLSRHTVPVSYPGADRPDRYHIVGEREIDNLTMARTIAAYLNRSMRYELVDFHAARPGHDRRYALDGSKLKSLGWTPPLELEASLQRTVAWSQGREAVAA